MDPREKAILEETFKMGKENNELLKKLYRGYRFGRIVKVAYWIVIIGVAVGAFYYIQPVVERLYEAVQQIHEGINESKGALNSLRTVGR